MRAVAKILAAVLAALVVGPLVPPPSPSCCPMGGDMACCAGATLDGNACTLRSCGGKEDSTAVTAAAPRALLAPDVILPEPSFGAPVSMSAEAPPLALSNAPPAPPPRG